MSVPIAVIPIAGLGTRLYPTTKVVPKAFFPVPDPKDGFVKPVIQLIIEEALSAEVEEICIVCSPKQEPEIRKYFNSDEVDAIKKKPDLNAQALRIADISHRLRFAIQEEPKGFGHAIFCAKDVVGTRPFMVLLGDHVYLSDSGVPETCAQQVLSVYKSCGLSVTGLHTCPEEDIGVNGLVNGSLDATNSRLYRLTDTVEKPDVHVARSRLIAPGVDPGSYLCYVGIEIFSGPGIFQALEENIRNGVLTKGEVQLRDAMRTVMEREGMFGYRVAGRRFDTGMPLPYAETVAAFSERFVARSL